VHHLTAAWRLLERDPVGILLPSSARLWATALAFAWVRRAWLSGDPHALVVGMAMGALLQWCVGGAGRAWALDRAIRARGLGGARVPWLRVAIVEAAERGVRTVSFVGAVAAGLLLGGALLSGGWFALGFFVPAISWIVASGFDLGWQSLFGTALVEVLLARQGALDALRRSARGFAADALPQLAIGAVGSLAVGIGGLCCGAGALPGYPLSDLARLDRWVARPQEHP
jgi:hypothetical protein